MYRFVAHGDDAEITNMFDIEGNETFDPGAAVKIVAKQADGAWLAAEVQRHEIVEAPTH
jgi:hypothetical protein